MHIEDARTFLANREFLYDLIISEPSNLWVSGVASLFTEEFYRQIKGRLQSGGLLVQWLHLYESNLDLTGSVFKALGAHLQDYAVYSTDNANILVIATNGGNTTDLDPWIFEQKALREALRRVGITRIGHLGERRVGDRALIGTALESRGVPANSDFFPYIGLLARRARFLREHALELTSLQFTAIPVLEMSGVRTPAPLGAARAGRHLSLHEFRRLSEKVFLALVSTERADRPSIPGKLGEAVELLAYQLDECPGPLPDERSLLANLFLVAAGTNPYLDSATLDRLWSHLAAQPCPRQLSSHAQAWIALHHAVGKRDATRMTELATRVLKGSGAPEQREHLDYLLSAGLIGAVVPGHKDEARSFLRQQGRLYLPPQGWPLHLQLLLSHL